MDSKVDSSNSIMDYSMVNSNKDYSNSMVYFIEGLANLMVDSDKD